MMTIASRLLQLRKERGLSQEELAEKLKVSRQAISKWERGDALPDLENLILLSELYGISLDRLVGRDSAPAPDKENVTAPSLETQEDGTVVEEKDGGTDDTDEETPEEDDTDGFDEDDEENETTEIEGLSIVIEGPKTKQERRGFSAFLEEAVPYPILATIIFLLWGFLGDGWQLAWILFVTIPLYYSLLEAFRRRRVDVFAYPVLVTVVYLFLGMAKRLWHPLWVLYLTVPVYYCIAEAIDAHRK